jgi:hypothetical protein
MNHDRTAMDRSRLTVLPTLTQLSRIRHTIDVLLDQQAWLAEKLSEPDQPADLQLLRPRYLHATEISSGWDGVQRMVDELPADSLQRVEYQEEVDEGTAGSRYLIECFRQQSTQ